MSEDARPSAEEIILYDKNPQTRIATITFNRPDQLNAPTIAARLRYAELLQRANIDDDVKVLVIRGVGDDLGSGADVPEILEAVAAPTDGPVLAEWGLEEGDVTYPPRGSYRRNAMLGSWYANAQSGCRSLQEFKKISILEVKGYCYGWHFYQATDADLVISSDDALFGHPAFRYVGWGPRMWTWAQTMGLRKFQEMVFTGRPFTAKEMYDCNFLNSVVPRDQLEAEVDKYADACSRTRPTDVVFLQKTFFEVMKQHQGEYMGSLLTGLLESFGRYVRPDADDLMLSKDVVSGGINHAVKNNDNNYPPDFRLSKSGRKDTGEVAEGDALTPPPMTGYLVVDLSSGIAGAYCTRLLADGGADVVKVEPPEGDWLRGWSASGAPIPPTEDGALFSFLAGAKQSVVVDPDQAEDLRFVGDLLDAADAVVWSRGSRLAEVPSLAPARLRQSHPHLTVTAITPFGLDGPWCDRPATEFTLQAWSGGIVGLGRGAPDRAPVHVGGQVGEWLSGAYAAAGTMTSWLRRGDSGRGELVDLSMLETQILCLTYYPVTFFEQLGRPWRTARSLFAPGVSAARDGLVALGCGTAQQWFDLCAMVGHPEWIDDDKPLVITERAAELAPSIREWIAGHTIQEICELASAFRIPHAPVGNGANVPTQEHFQARRSLRANARDGFVEPDHPYRLHPATLRAPGHAPRLGEHTAVNRTRRRMARPAAPPSAGELPFSGLRVLDMTAFWAGPSCTHVLALLGAEVIHLESTSRPDGTRLLAGVAATEQAWWERSPIFSGLNTNKKSLTINFQDERGLELLRRLIPTCDVIVESFTPRVLEAIGLDYEAVRALRPDAVMVRMPGFGLDGPWRDNAAFAYVIEDASGLTWLTGYPDQHPVEPYSLGDPNAGLHALNALLLALRHRRQTGEGVLVEAAMVDAALNIAAEQVIEASAYGSLLQRDGNRGPAAAPQNLYLSADVDEFGRTDCWVAIAVATDAQWTGLRTALAAPDWAADPVLGTASGRRAAHDRIDAHLADWCARRGADEIVAALWDAGVPVAKVMQPHRQTELPPLAARRFFEPVEHPVSGAVPHSTLPIRFSGGPQRYHLRHAPLLGQHNAELLGELGLTPEDIATLEAKGTIGRDIMSSHTASAR